MQGSIAVLLIIAIFSLSCRKRTEKEVDSRHIALLKTKYNASVINYFYETVFHEDEADEKLNNLRKWRSNPQIVVRGNPSAEEISYVKDAIFKVNRMNLPIQCELNDEAKTNVLEISFDQALNADKQLEIGSVSRNSDPKRHLAISRARSHDGTIDGASITIFYNQKDTLASLRRNIVLEEIIQALGVTGDSYSYPNSLFFQNYNPYKAFTPIDSSVLSLLYEDAIPFDYSRSSFEKDFGDVLNHVDVNNKLGKLLRSSPGLISGNELESCFTAGELLKHPQEVVVFLKGAILPTDSATLKKAITAINGISTNLNLRLARPNELEPDYGITLSLIQSENQTVPINRNIKVLKGDDCMFPKLTKNDVALSFNASEKARKFRDQSMVDALYFSLIQLPQERVQGTVAVIEQDDIKLTKHYADLLKLIYSNEFTDGLNLNDFKKIKSSLGK